ncbi:MAG: nicotinamidase [Actinobacteria bacterium]|nr:nicotinamidase [Actinomycetota bacterium]
MVRINQDDALVIVDPQNDFMPGGALAVPGGDEIFPILSPLIRSFPLVVASQDWHPANHISFKEQGGPWPPHCVQRTKGAEFHPDLDQSRLSIIVRKGFDARHEQYSCFDETSKLSGMLKGRGVSRIFVVGVATDYCVRYSVHGALEGGLGVFVLTDAVRGVDVKPGDSERALAEMKAAGAVLITSSELAFL